MFTYLITKSANTKDATPRVNLQTNKHTTVISEQLVFPTKNWLGNITKDKIPRPNGWTMEFFLSFYDMIEDELFRIIEESRNFGKVLDGFNITFIVLILKKDNHNSLDTLDLYPSLYNCIYNI